MRRTPARFRRPWWRNSSFPSVGVISVSDKRCIEQKDSLEELKKKLRLGRIRLSALVELPGSRYRLPSVGIRVLRPTVFRSLVVFYLLPLLITVIGSVALLTSAIAGAEGKTPAEWAGHACIYLVLSVWFSYKTVQPSTRTGQIQLLEQFRFIAWVNNCRQRKVTRAVTFALAITWVLQVIVDGTLSPSVSAPSVAALGLDRFAVVRGELWRLPLSAFLHADPIHIFLNASMLWITGSWCEAVLGPRSLVHAMLAGLLLGAVGSLVFYSGVPTIGASGAISGVLGLLATVMATTRSAFPSSLALQLGTFIVIWLAYGLISVGVDNAMHIGGLLGGGIAGTLLMKKPHLQLNYRDWLRSLARFTTKP